MWFWMLMVSITSALISTWHGRKLVSRYLMAQLLATAVAALPSWLYGYSSILYAATYSAASFLVCFLVVWLCKDFLRENHSPILASLIAAIYSGVMTKLAISGTHETGLPSWLVGCLILIICILSWAGMALGLILPTIKKGELSVAISLAAAWIGQAAFLSGWLQHFSSPTWQKLGYVIPALGYCAAFMWITIKSSRKGWKHAN